MTPDTQQPTEYTAKDMFRLSISEFERAVEQAFVGFEFSKSKCSLAYDWAMQEIERLQKLTLAFHSADEKPNSDEDIYFLMEREAGGLVIRDGHYNAATNSGYYDSFFTEEEAIKVPWDDVKAWYRYSDLLRAFESHLKQKGAANGNV